MNSQAEPLLAVLPMADIESPVIPDPMEALRQKNDDLESTSKFNAYRTKKMLMKEAMLLGLFVEQLKHRYNKLGDVLIATQAWMTKQQEAEKDDADTRSKVCHRTHQARVELYYALVEENISFPDFVRKSTKYLMMEAAKPSNEAVAMLDGAWSTGKGFMESGSLVEHNGKTCDISQFLWLDRGAWQKSIPQYIALFAERIAILNGLVSDATAMEQRLLGAMVSGIVAIAPFLIRACTGSK